MKSFLYLTTVREKKQTEQNIHNKTGSRLRCEKKHEGPIQSKETMQRGQMLFSFSVCRHLLQNSSMTLDTVSDLTRDILDLADNDITDKVSSPLSSPSSPWVSIPRPRPDPDSRQVLLLERRVAELEKESEASGEQHTRLRQKNLQLVHRANALEEQLKEQELHTDEQLQQESRRHKEALNKLERERGLEMENLQARYGP